MPDPTIADPTIHCFWENLSETAFAVVQNKAPAIAARLRAHAPWAPLNCDFASAAWLVSFLAAGCQVRYVYGHYWPGVDSTSEPPTSTDHTWLVVDGSIFDPTAGQFGAPIDSRHYLEIDELK